MVPVKLLSIINHKHNSIKINIRRAVMNNKLFLAVLVICLGICFTSCVSFRSSGMQIGMSTSGTENLGNFTTTVSVNKFLGTSAGTTFLNLSSDVTDGKIRTAIEKEIQKKGGTAAINISIKYWAGPFQFILNALTGTLWAPGTLTITGTVIRQN
jgi:hypothetical protein